MGLEPYARAFALEGMAALVFTYRHFGDSDGMPRRLIDVDHQLGDWVAALAYARTIEEIDSTRIALWGTSFGGGHVIEVGGSWRRGRGCDQPVSLHRRDSRRCAWTVHGASSDWPSEFL